MDAFTQAKPCEDSIDYSPIAVLDLERVWHQRFSTVDILVAGIAAARP
jgi:hypothetical protein